MRIRRRPRLLLELNQVSFCALWCCPGIYDIDSNNNNSVLTGHRRVWGRCGRCSGSAWWRKLIRCTSRTRRLLLVYCGRLASTMHCVYMRQLVVNDTGLAVCDSTRTDRALCCRVAACQQQGSLLAGALYYEPTLMSHALQCHACCPVPAFILLWSFQGPNRPNGVSSRRRSGTASRGPILPSSPLAEVEGFQKKLTANIRHASSLGVLRDIVVQYQGAGQADIGVFLAHALITWDDKMTILVEHPGLVYSTHLSSTLAVTAHL